MNTFSLSESDFPADKAGIKALLKATQTADEHRYAFLVALEGLVESGIPLADMKGLSFPDIDNLQYAMGSVTGLRDRSAPMTERARQILGAHIRRELPGLFGTENTDRNVSGIREVSVNNVRELLLNLRPHANNGGLKPLEFSDDVVREVEATVRTSRKASSFTIRPITAVFAALIEGGGHRMTVSQLSKRVGYEESGVLRAIESIQTAAEDSWKLVGTPESGFLLWRKGES